MVRISGVDLPRNKRIDIGLTYIFGIGHVSAKKIIADTKIEYRMIKRMKKGSRIMITGYNQKGSQTIDHYSLLGFTKAYNATKKACS